MTLFLYADDRAVRNGGDDQVADTCFRFLVPTKERFPGAQRLSARRAIRAYPREADYYFPALGLPIVPRTHFRTHRTRRAPINPAATAAAPPRGGPVTGLRTSIQPSRIGPSRLFGHPGSRHPSIVRSQDTRMDSNIVGFELTELCLASSSCKQLFSRIQSQPGSVSQCGNT
ncbi:hypothetical protein ACFW04_010857 [Cataglyphis niger]